MCTVILLSRPGHIAPLLLAANRDEMLDRPWAAPAAHWPDQPGVVGGIDRLAGGTWLAVNGSGVVAAVLNRAGSLGPEAGRRSRGELPLLALRHRSAAQAVSALTALESGAYRSFNLVIADQEGAYVLRGLGGDDVTLCALPAGLHMITSGEPDDLTDPRIALHLPAFAAAPTPRPPDWGAWPALLQRGGQFPQEALNVPPTGGFGTASTALLAGGPVGRRWFQFAAGPPGQAPYLDVGWPASPGHVRPALG